MGFRAYGFAAHGLRGLRVCGFRVRGLRLSGSGGIGLWFYNFRAGVWGFFEGIEVLLFYAA